VERGRTICEERIAKLTILAPRFIKKQSDDKEETEPILAGFLAVPVFKVQDTEGEPLDYERIELPKLPLMEVAKEWSISVKAIPGNYQCSGYFRPGQKGDWPCLKGGDGIFSRVISCSSSKTPRGTQERPGLEAGNRCRVCSRNPLQNRWKNLKAFRNSHRYIEEYSKQANLTPWQACLKVISDTEKVLTLILDWKRPTLSRSTIRERRKQLVLEGRTREPAIQLYDYSAWAKRPTKELN